GVGTISLFLQSQGYSPAAAEARGREIHTDVALDADQASLASPAAELGGRCIIVGGGGLVSGTLHYAEPRGEYDVIITLNRGETGRISVHVIVRPVIFQEGYNLGAIDLYNY